MQDLKFIKANATLPRGVVTTTARKGDKWSKDVKPGDIVNLLVTENGANFGRAAIIGTKLTTFKEVCEGALSDNNHALTGAKSPDAVNGDAPWTPAEACAKLAEDLKAAYGDLEDGEAFTVVALVVLNPDHVGV